MSANTDQFISSCRCLKKQMVATLFLSVPLYCSFQCLLLNGCITYELYHQQRLKQQQMSKTKPRSISKTKESKKESEWVTTFNLPLVSYPD